MGPDIRITQTALPFTQPRETGGPPARQLTCYRISVSFGDVGGSGDSLRQIIATLADSLTKSMDIQEWTMLAFVDIEDVAQWLGCVGQIECDESVRLYSSELESVIIKSRTRSAAIPDLSECVAFELGRFVLQGHKVFDANKDALNDANVGETDSWNFGRDVFSWPKTPILFGQCDVVIQLWGTHNADEVLCAAPNQALMPELSRTIMSALEGPPPQSEEGT